MMNHNLPPSSYASTMPAQMMAQASSSTVSSVEDVANDKYGKPGSAPSKIGQGHKRKRRDRSRSRSPLHTYSEEQALELFGPTLTMYSVCGPQGGFRIGTGNLQCPPEDNGRASYSIQVDGEMAQRLAEETQRARDELPGTKSGPVSVRNPRAGKRRAGRRRQVQATNTVLAEDKQDGMSNPDPNQALAQSRSGRPLKSSMKKVQGVGDGTDESSLPSSRKKRRRMVSKLTYDGELASNSETKEMHTEESSCREITSSPLSEAPSP